MLREMRVVVSLRAIIGRQKVWGLCPTTTYGPSNEMVWESVLGP